MNFELERKFGETHLVHDFHGLEEFEAAIGHSKGLVAHLRKENGDQQESYLQKGR